MSESELAGHKLNMASLDGIARCQCNAWQWHVGADLAEAYEGHIKQEQKREAELIAAIRSAPAGPSRLAKVGQLAVVYLVFMAVAFTILHFIG
jgi:hypothetical protein